MTDVERDLLKALKWAMTQGNLTYMQRTKSNTEYCDAVDAARQAITKAQAQGETS